MASFVFYLFVYVSAVYHFMVSRDKPFLIFVLQGYKLLLHCTASSLIATNEGVQRDGAVQLLNQQKFHLTHNLNLQHWAGMSHS